MRKHFFTFLLAFFLNGAMYAAFVPVTKNDDVTVSTVQKAPYLGNLSTIPKNSTKLTKKTKNKKQDVDDIQEWERLRRNNFAAGAAMAVLFWVFLLTAIFILLFVMILIGIILFSMAFIFMILWIVFGSQAAAYNRKINNHKATTQNPQNNTNPQPTTKQDVVYLKNGSVVKGTIIEMIPNESIKVEIMGGSIMLYKMDEIERIQKE